MQNETRCQCIRHSDLLGGRDSPRLKPDFLVVDLEIRDRDRDRDNHGGRWQIQARAQAPRARVDSEVWPAVLVRRRRSGCLLRTTAAHGTGNHGEAPLRCSAGAPEPGHFALQHLTLDGQASKQTY